MMGKILVIMCCIEMRSFNFNYNSILFSLCKKGVILKKTLWHVIKSI